MKILKDKKYFLFIFLLFFLFIIIIFIPKHKKDKINEKPIINQVNNELKDNSLEIFKIINNINSLKTGKFKSELKFFANEEELLTIGFNASFNHDINNLVKGYINFHLNNSETQLKFPIYVKNFGKDTFEGYLDIPKNYRSILNMNEKEQYIYMNKNNILNLKSFFKTENLKTLNEKENIKSINNKIKYNEIDPQNCFYNINLNKDDIKTIYNYLEDDNNNNNIKKFFDFIINDKENLEKISSLNGIIYGKKIENNYIATDIYIEIKNNSGSIIAFRLVLENLNDENIKIDDSKIDNYIDFEKIFNLLKNNIKVEDKKVEESIDNETTSNDSDDIDPYLDKETEEEIKNEEKTITINEIFFTGKDESIQKDNIDKDNNENKKFIKKDIDGKINVFINFSNCTKKTNLIVKWYYNDQTIPIIENKLSNGEYEEGILKSSITFNDINQIQLGTYTMKLYIENNEQVIKESSFTIMDE